MSNAPWAHGQAIGWSDKIASDSFQDRPLCICRVMLPVCALIAVYQASICIGTSHSPYSLLHSNKIHCRRLFHFSMCDMLATRCRARFNRCTGGCVFVWKSISAIAWVALGVDYRCIRSSLYLVSAERRHFLSSDTSVPIQPCRSWSRRRVQSGSIRRRCPQRAHQEHMVKIWRRHRK